MARAGLRKVVKSVRGKRGTVRRTYWVRAKDAATGAGRFLSKHKGKIAAGAALAAGAYLAHKHKGMALAAHAAGMKRGTAFYKAAQQAQWSRKDAVRNAVKGYAQGVRKSGLGDSIRGAATGAASAVRGAASKFAGTRAGSAVSGAAAKVAGAARSTASRAWNSVGSPKGAGKAVRQAASAVAGAAKRGTRRAANSARGYSNQTGLVRR